MLNNLHFLWFLLFSCSTNNTKVELAEKTRRLNDFVEARYSILENSETGEYKIIGKWVSHESKAINCENCVENDKSCCVVRFNGKRYIRSQSFMLTEEGKVDSIYSYAVPLGVNCYSIEEFLKVHVMNEELKLQFTNGRIYWDKKLKALVDNNDTITDLKVDSVGGFLYKQDERELIQYEFNK